MRDVLADGRVFRTLIVVGDYTREDLVIRMNTSLPGERIAREREQVATAKHLLGSIVVDSNPEFASGVAVSVGRYTWHKAEPNRVRQVGPERLCRELQR